MKAEEEHGDTYPDTYCIRHFSPTRLIIVAEDTSLWQRKGVVRSISRIVVGSETRGE